MKKGQEELPEIPSSRGDDLHNIQHMHSADLVLFMAGNQFMVMKELMRAFQELHPEVKNIFYETLPPGLELRQILAGGARYRDLVIDVIPDIYSSVTEDAMLELKVRNLIDESFIYLHNRIVLMVPAGNPRALRKVSDLGREDIRISQPGEMEDISRYITAMYEKAGGRTLVRQILENKRAEGTTIFTIVHHRETPLRITKGTVDVGPVWATEVVNGQHEGLKIEAIEPGKDLDQSNNVKYYITKLKKGGNSENADKFLDFIGSAPAQELYESYGFVPHFSR